MNPAYCGLPNPIALQGESSTLWCTQSYSSPRWILHTVVGMTLWISKMNPAHCGWHDPMDLQSEYPAYCGWHKGNPAYCGSPDPGHSQGESGVLCIRWKRKRTLWRRRKNCLPRWSHVWRSQSPLTALCPVWKSPSQRRTGRLRGQNNLPVFVVVVVGSFVLWFVVCRLTEGLTGVLLVVLPLMGNVGD